MNLLKIQKLIGLIGILVIFAGCGKIQTEIIHYEIPTNPLIIKTHERLANEFEAQPFIWKGKLKYILQKRFSSGAGNGIDGAALQIYDFETKKLEHEFAQGQILPSIIIENGKAYVFSVNKWATANTSIILNTSTDLINWTSQVLFIKDKVFNTTVSKTTTGYVMAYEIFNGNDLSTQFMVSNDLINWNQSGVIFSEDHDASCPTIRFIDGKYYLWYLIRYEGKPYYITKIARSDDLANWEISPKVFLAPDISELQNNSDMDLETFNGVTYIFYNAGNQNDQFWVTYATYSGDIEKLVKEYF